MSEYTVEQAISMALQHIRICAPDPVVDAALEAALLERRASAADDEEVMCPNCVTPWKCNGPHIGLAPGEDYEPPAQASAVPYGWKWVSREPTNEMCSAPDSVWNPEARVIWQQMFDAAPQPPKVQS